MTRSFGNEMVKRTSLERRSKSVAEVDGLASI